MDDETDEEISIVNESETVIEETEGAFHIASFIIIIIITIRIHAIAFSRNFGWSKNHAPLSRSGRVIKGRGVFVSAF